MYQIDLCYTDITIDNFFLINCVSPFFASKYINLLKLINFSLCKKKVNKYSNLKISFFFQLFISNFINIY